MSKLGNTCRSPIVEAVFIDEVKKAGVEGEWEIDSAAIASWHVGRYPNSRGLAIMRKYNLESNHKARQVSSMFKSFVDVKTTSHQNRMISHFDVVLGR